MQEVPIWKALAEISIRTRLPIWVLGNSEVQFHDLGEHIYDQYQMTGPFFVGVHWSPNLVRKNSGKESPGMVIEVQSLRTDGAIRLPGITETVLEVPGKMPLSLQLAENKSNLNRHSYYSVPRDAFAKKRRLRVSF